MMEYNKNNSRKTSKGTSSLIEDDIQSNNHRHKYRKRCKNHRHILHKIKLEKKMFKCVINLNTTFCRHGRVGSLSDHKVTSKKPEDRITPLCSRETCCAKLRKCKNSYRRSCRESHHLKKHCKSHKHNTKDKRSIDKQKTENEKKDKGRFLETPEHLLKDEISYDEISHTSFNTPERPSSYKHVKYIEKYESKLDTLIKRTKERERNLVAQWRNNATWLASSPICTEITSSDFSMSNMSIHSRTTFVLEPLDYQTEQNYSNDLWEERLNKPYSPSSPIHNETQLNRLETKAFKVNIKTEPQLDIGLYSPTRIEYRNNVKTEINEYSFRNDVNFNDVDYCNAFDRNIIESIKKETRE